MGHHAPVSPSALHRQLACPGARAAELPYPDVSGAAAIDGTGSHELLEICINAGHDAAQYIGHTISEGHHDKPGGWKVDAARAERVQMALTYIASRIEQLVGQGVSRDQIHVHSEVKSDPGRHFGRTDWYGTCDILITWPGGAEAADYKDGRGYVSEKRNPQNTSYLGGVHDTHWYRSDRECRMTIIQPKTKNPIRFVNLTGAEAMEQLEEIHRGIVLGDDPNAPRIPGDHCRYCKHKPNCIEHAAQSTNGLKKMNEILKVDEVLGLPVTELTGSQIAELLDVRETVEARFKEIEDEANKRVKDTPDAIPGYAMSPGRATRSYTRPGAEIMAALKKLKMPMPQYQDIKVKSFVQLEKEDFMKNSPKRWKNFERDYIATVAGKDKLRPIAKAKPVKDVESMFQDIPTDAPKIISFM